MVGDYSYIRSGRRTGIKPKGKQCPNCSNLMTFIKDVPAYVCMHCSTTQYFDEPTKEEAVQEPPSSSSSSIGGITSIDGLSDTQPSRPVTTAKFHAVKDIRSRSQYAKPSHSEVDPELADFIEHNPTYRLVSYTEHTEQSRNVVDKDRLKDVD